ncbi:DUF4236 domain-containing protein [Clostridium sp. 'White wine YQ']|uniref:DUF4236 domain-containing protein n=1 Tax=Clostridium sp. 'White wine YQ' TaxID=3027474 RepID=UPI0023660689|nr:DUF4236 domain-containing protein [Clostridium sp. 'White wine YQ']MDD7793661.1 DUF4236 domain-containing protein [Clostridium sp. 'White wine YQ']
MGLKMRRSVKLAPGVRLNVGKKSMGVSFGTKGARYSINSSGRRTTTVGIPGTGISYSTTTSKKSNSIHPKSSVSSQRVLEKEARLQAAKEEVDEYNSLITSIKSIHKVSDPIISWVKLYNIPKPFETGTIGPNELNARRILENYKPGFIANIFKSMQVSKRKALELNIAKAKDEDTRNYELWLYQNSLASKILSGDIDTMLEVIEKNRPLDDLLAYGSEFEIFIEDPKTAEVEFEVLSNEVIPDYVLSLTSTGKVSSKNMPKGARLDLIQDYVCSCVLRVARDMFAILPFETVIIHANDTTLNSVTGHDEKVTILSVKIDKKTLYSLNLNSIDPSDSMSNFKCNMQFRKTLGFKPIEKIEI